MVTSSLIANIKASGAIEYGIQYLNGQWNWVKNHNFAQSGNIVNINEG